MNNDFQLWIKYAQDNYKASYILLSSHLYNPCLQNIQQSIEKYLKAILIEQNIKLAKTHNILYLIEQLKENNIYIDIEDDEIDIIDSFYIESKYPFGGSVLANFMPDEVFCKKCLNIMNKVKNSIEEYLKAQGYDI